jgi:DNA-binding FadR family transcriptional regulator
LETIMSSAPEVGHSRRLYQQIVDKMLVLLESGEYPPGVRLPSERVLSERFDVGRPTIREAVIALEVMGRVTVKTGSGVYVLENNASSGAIKDFSPFELTEARILLEGEAAALAASMITDEQIVELELAMSDMTAENQSGDLTSEVADRKFHSVISKATQNRVLIDVIARLWDIQQLSPDIYSAHKSVCKNDGKRRLMEHKAILDALAQRDSQMARVAMRNHFSRMIDTLHDATEAKAVEEVRRKVEERRERFSLNRLAE